MSDDRARERAAGAVAADTLLGQLDQVAATFDQVELIEATGLLAMAIRMQGLSPESVTTVLALLVLRLRRTVLAATGGAPLPAAAQVAAPPRAGARPGYWPAMAGGALGAFLGVLLAILAAHWLI